MSLIKSLSTLSPTSYTHPIQSPPASSSRLNPYLPLPAHSTLFTDSTFLPSLPTTATSSVIHILGASTITIPRGESVIALISRTAQEGYDHALLAARVARENIGVYHFIAPSALDGSIEEVADALNWIEGKDTPALNGFHHDESPSDHLVHLYESASLSLLKVTRRPQRAFVDHHAGSARLIINFLPIALDVQNTLDITLAHPLPRDKIRHAVRGAGEIVVVEGGEGRFGAYWASVEDALEGLDYDIRSVLVGSISSISTDLHSALEGKSVITRIGTESIPSSIPTNSVTVPTAESNYTNLLTTSPSPLEILNDPSSLAANESTSPLYAFGKAVAIRRERDRLVELAKSILKAPNTSQELHQTLGAWLLVRDDSGNASAEAGSNVEAALGNASSAEEKELLELGSKGHWARKNLWIVISNAWANDLASSGLHHALSSGLDINLLVYETAPSPFSSLSTPQLTRERKKDLALYALNMGDVYVSSVAVYADYAGVINAMRESEAYSGPGLVLAYLPWGEKEDGESVGQGEVAGPLERLRETKRAVAGGWWPMFRWNPEAEDGQQFTLDSPAIKTALSQFLDRQSHLSQLSRAKPAFDPSLTASLGNDLVSARKEKAKKAYDALVNSLDGPGLLVLYGSDGGAAEKVAKKLVSRAKMRGVGATIGILDGIASAIIERLKEEKNVVMITSTAGQGEFPQNAREFWKTISKTAESEIKVLVENEVKVAVFGMGDSHYWPRPEDAGYYNKASKDLHAKISTLGVQELLPLGLGDDSDPDGHMTGYKPWESNLWKALGVDAVEVEEVVEETVANEHMKIASDYLRGTILEGLADKTTGAIGASDAQLTKFHGTYMQDDRDIRESLKEQGLEPAYSFMIRCRLPGGVCNPDQWLHMDRISDEHGNGTFKLTTRQTFQFHGIIKSHLKSAMQAINKSMMDTIAACGDVNRNVQCTVNPALSHTHNAVYEFSKNLSEHLLPKTSAYHEIWLDKKQVAGGEIADLEPLYGPTYLPRKFKLAVAVPPDNAVDVYTNDVGFIAIIENDEVVGYNVVAGGGMGVTHSNKKTYPRLGDLLGFVDAKDAVKAAESIMLTQRDNGNRKDRKNARLKYTIDAMTLPVFMADVESRFGQKFQPARPFKFTHNTDNYGWVQGRDGNWHFTMFIENGRIEDSPRNKFKTGLAELAKLNVGQFRLTANQHLVFANIPPNDKPEVERVMSKWGLDMVDHSALRLSSSACVAFPTCGLAMAESERYLPLLVDKVEKICEDAGVRGDSIVMRMTGCPNGCARPWNAEIAFVGKAPGSYMMMLGGSPLGNRLSKPWKSSVTEPEILALLKPMIKQWALERQDGEAFGDWVIREGIIKETTHGTNFWKDTEAS